MAVRYNDISVLENHHVASAYSLLVKEEYNIFEGCSLELYKEIRETVIKLVLATDFAKHFDILGQFKTKIASGFDYNKLEDRRLVLMIALKCADISHPAKEKRLHLKWTNGVTEEFYRQGDLEKNKSLPPSPFMDRQTGDLAKSQIGFISFLVLPLYKVFSEQFEDSLGCYEILKDNLDFWKQQAESKK